MTTSATAANGTRIGKNHALIPPCDWSVRKPVVSDRCPKNVAQGRIGNVTMPIATVAAIMRQRHWMTSGTMP